MAAPEQGKDSPKGDYLRTGQERITPEVPLVQANEGLNLLALAQNDTILRKGDTAKLYTEKPEPKYSSNGQAGVELEERALHHALRHSLTPRGLGRQGCMAAIDDYVLKPFFEKNGITAPQFNSTYKFIDWFKQNDMGTITVKKQSDVKVSDFKPGDIVIPEKVDGSQHAMVVSRVPENWGYPSGALMFNGNTGLNLPGGPGKPHFRAAQEVIGQGTDIYNHHHGQFNSRMHTNPYLGGKVRILRFN